MVHYIHANRRRKQHSKQHNKQHKHKHKSHNPQKLQNEHMQTSIQTSIQSAQSVQSMQSMPLPTSSRRADQDPPLPPHSSSTSSTSIMARMGIILTIAALMALLWYMLGAQSAQSAAPTGQYEITAGTVTDIRTRLQWERSPEQNNFSFTDATIYCEDLALEGFTDWRLPSIRELKSIVDHTSSFPAIDIDAFPETSSGQYWSNTPLIQNPSPNNAPQGIAPAFIRTVFFGNGQSQAQSIDSVVNVRCVRTVL